MRKRSSRTSSDPNVAAKKVVDKLTGSGEEQEPTPPPEKNPAAVTLGRLGGKKGGKARARNLTKEQLSEIGKKGAAARWRPREPEEEPKSD